MVNVRIPGGPDQMTDDLLWLGVPDAVLRAMGVRFDPSLTLEFACLPASSLESQEIACP